MCVCVHVPREEVVKVVVLVKPTVQTGYLGLQFRGCYYVLKRCQ